MDARGRGGGPPGALLQVRGSLSGLERRCHRRAGWWPYAATGHPAPPLAALMFTLLHQVCTGIPGKVQTMIPALTVAIVLLEVYVQRYVQIRILICTIYRERRACLQGRVTRVLVSVKSAVVQTCRIFWRISDGSENRLHLIVFHGANLGAKGCKCANDCPGQPRHSHLAVLKLRFYEPSFTSPPPGGKGRALACGIEKTIYRSVRRRRRSTRCDTS